MLTKKQLLDAAQCCSECDECACEMVGYRYEHCIKATAETALAYMEMLERARETLQDAWEDDGSTTIGKQMLEIIKAIDALIGGKEDV